MRFAQSTIGPTLALLFFLPLCASAQDAITVRKNASYLVELSFLPTASERVSGRLLRDFASGQLIQLDAVMEERIASECGMNEEQTSADRLALR